MDEENVDCREQRLVGLVDLVNDLREYAEWAEANIWEVPITLPDVLSAAAEVIETEVIGKCQDGTTR